MAELHEIGVAESARSNPRGHTVPGGFRHGLPQTDRRGRRGRQGLGPCRSGGRAQGRGATSGRSSRGTVARRAPRRPRRAEGQLRRRRAHDDSRGGRLRPSAPVPRRALRGAAARRRSDRAREGDHHGLCLSRSDPDLQSVEPRAHSRWIVERSGGGRRCAHGAAGARDPDGRVGPASRGVLRRGRSEADLRPDQHGRRGAARVESRPRGDLRPRGGGLRARPGGAGRARWRRSNLDGGRCRRLHRCGGSPVCRRGWAFSGGSWIARRPRWPRTSSRWCGHSARREPS